MEKREPSCTVGGNLNWYNQCADQYGGAGVQPQLIQGIRRRDGVGEGQETTA